MDPNIATNMVSQMGATVSSSFLGTIYAVLTAVSFFFLLEEEGEKGWKRFIPIYGTYTCYKTFYKKSKFFLYVISTIVLIISILGMVITAALIEQKIFTADYLGFFALLLLILIIVCLIIIICVSIGFDISISHKYGKKGLFTFGMIFITPIFLAYLAWENRYKLKQ